MKNLVIIFLASLSIFSISSCFNVRINEIKEWNDIFEKHGLEGAFELYDNNKETSNYHNLELCSEAVAPAHTFFIPMTIIAIETSTVADESKPIKWLKEFPSEHYNDSLSLKEAFHQHNNHFFITLHNKINKDYYEQYFDSMAYGNKAYDKDDIWTNGTVKISLDEQVGLMKRIYHNKIKFVSERTTTIMKSMLLTTDKSDVKFFSYSSPVTINGNDYYWIIGMIENYNPLKNPKTERIDNVVHPYFFGLLVKSKSGKITEEQANKLLFDLLTHFQIRYE